MAKIPLLDLVDQLVAAVRDAPPATPMGQKGDWVVMAAWLVQLRSLLLLPADAPARQAAKDEADRFRDRLSGLAEIQALAAWLDRRPHLGRDVFARGQPPEGFDLSVDEAGPEIDVIEFLWASMALFDDGDPGPDVSETYRPRWRDLYSIRGGPRADPETSGGDAGRAAARTTPAGGVRRRPGFRPSPALKQRGGLDQHLHRQPRTGEAGRGGVGAGRIVSPPFTSGRRRWKHRPDVSCRSGGRPRGTCLFVSFEFGCLAKPRCLQHDGVVAVSGIRRIGAAQNA